MIVQRTDLRTLAAYRAAGLAERSRIARRMLAAVGGGIAALLSRAAAPRAPRAC